MLTLLIEWLAWKDGGWLISILLYNEKALLDFERQNSTSLEVSVESFTLNE